MANTTKTTVKEVEEQNVNIEKDDRLEMLEKQNEELREQLKSLMSMMANMSSNSSSRNSLMEEVKIIHLVERAAGLTTHIQLSTITLDMTAFGEERTLDRRQAEELAGKCRKLFEKGIIAFGSGCEEVAQRFALKTVNSYNYINSDFVRKLGIMNAAEIEELYSKLCDGHKSFILEYFKRKIIEGDPAFADPYKVETLNRVSGGCMSDMILDRQRKSVIGDTKD